MYIYFLFSDETNETEGENNSEEGKDHDLIVMDEEMDELMCVKLT